MKSENFIEFVNISKVFPGVRALSDISFSIKRGEIHCLCGENGAGKSTLINICGGVYMPDGGHILINDRQERLTSPLKSEELKISIVFQEIPLCRNLSIAANIFLGPKPVTRGGLLDWDTMNAEAEKLIRLFGIRHKPDELVENLTIAEQSLVQIARAIHMQPDFLILDEPTAALSVNQKDVLFDVLRKIRKERELTVLYVSHRLEEIFEITDRITVLRDGKYVKTETTSEVNADRIVNLMVGRELSERVCSSDRVKGKTILEVKNISHKGVLKDISFSLKEGEILGIAGLQGAGRTELMRTIFGLDPRDSGEIILDGTRISIKSPVDAIKRRIGLISENRRDEGIVPLMSVKDNLISVSLKELSQFTFFSRSAIKKTVSKFIDKLKIKVTSPDQKIDGLSGGNQQKVIIARWLAKNPRVLICDEPTRGIDVGAKAEVHNILVELANQRVAVIVISSDLPEILCIADRILVMHEGQINGELEHNEANEEIIMKMATGLC